jgi:hypothetical protein
VQLDDAVDALEARQVVLLAHDAVVAQGLHGSGHVFDLEGHLGVVAEALPPQGGHVGRKQAPAAGSEAVRPMVR